MQEKIYPMVAIGVSFALQMDKKLNSNIFIKYLCDFIVMVRKFEVETAGVNV